MNGDQERDRGRERQKQTEGKRGGRREGDMLDEENLHSLNILQCFLYQHTVRPHSNPALTHTERCVCAHIFMPPKDIVVMLVKSKPCPVKTHPFRSNRELCKPMQRPLYSLCYSKLSMWAVDKEMQSGSPLTPGSLCKQYRELLGTLLITL